MLRRTPSSFAGQVTLLASALLSICVNGQQPRQCSGLAIDQATVKGLGGATIRVVPFLSEQSSLSFTADENGKWSCQPALPTGQYLLQAAARGFEPSEETFVLSIDSDGRASERSNGDVQQLDFVLRRVAIPSPGLPSAPKGPETPPPDKPSAPSPAVPPDPVAEPELDDMPEEIPSNPPRATPDGKKPWLDPLPPAIGGECWETLTVSVVVRPRKIDGDTWDLGWLGFVHPDLKMIVQPLRSASQKSPCSSEEQKELAPIVLPNEQVSLAQCQPDRHSGDGGMFCRDNLQFSFNLVRVPRLPLHLFLMDIDLAAHDLIFEHRENLFAKQFAILDAISTRGSDPSCDYKGKGSECSLRVGEVEMARVSFEAKKPCMDRKELEAKGDQVLSSIQADALSVVKADLPGGFWLAVESVKSGFEAGRDAAGAELENKIQTAIKACDLRAVYAATIRTIVPMLSTRPSPEVSAEMRENAKKNDVLSEDGGRFTVKVQKDKISNFADDLAKRGQSIHDSLARDLTKRPEVGTPPVSKDPKALADFKKADGQATRLKTQSIMLKSLLKVQKGLDIANTYQTEGASAAICDMASAAATAVSAKGPAFFMDCKMWRDMFYSELLTATGTEDFQKNNLTFARWAARRGALAAIVMGYQDEFASKVETSILDIYAKLSADYSARVKR